MRSLVTALALFFGLSHSTAQLSGVYDVGPDGDFPDLSAAVTQAVSQGLADSTIFEVQPGAGNLFTLTIPAIPGAAPDRPLIIRSASADTSEVVLSRLELTEAAHIRLEGFTLSAIGGNTPGALALFSCHDIEVAHCRLVDLPGMTYPYGQALLNVNFPYSGGTGELRFRYCTMISHHRTVWVVGTGTNRFQACTLEGDMRWPGGTSFFEDCTLRLTTIEEVRGHTFVRCTFGSSLNEVRLRGALLLDSDFECRVRLSVDEVRGNRFKRVDRSYGNTLMVGNEMDTTTFTYCHGERVIGNKFRGPVKANADAMSFYNNSFDVGLELTQGPSQLVRYNSFGPGAYLKTWYISGTVEFNSLWDLTLVEQPSVTMLRRNNYANPVNPINAYYAAYDPQPTFHDPEYDTSSGYWKATNLQLTGRGDSNYSYAALDIDSVPRTLLAAAGANVICVDGQLPDSLALACGQLGTLRLCSGHNGLVLSPLPANGIVNLDTLPASGGLYVYLSDTSGLVLDSCWVFRTPPADRPLVDLWTLCDLPVQLHAPFDAQYADSMVWSPTGVFDDPHLPHQVLTTDSTMIVTATVYTACGPFQQPFRVNVQDDPYANYTVTSVADTVWVAVNPNCCDSIQWDMGDGTFYTAPEVMHVYDGSLAYATIVLWCWRNGEVGGTTWFLVLPGMGVAEMERSSLRVHPNPANSLVEVAGTDDRPLHVALTLYDLMGRPVLQREGILPLTLDVNGLSTGRYTIVVESPTNTLRAPLLILRE